MCINLSNDPTKRTNATCQAAHVYSTPSLPQPDTYRHINLYIHIHIPTMLSNAKVYPQGLYASGRGAVSLATLAASLLRLRAAIVFALLVS